MFHILKIPYKIMLFDKVMSSLVLLSDQLNTLLLFWSFEVCKQECFCIAQFIGVGIDLIDRKRLKGLV